MNNQALRELIDVHNVQLKKLPDELLMSSESFPSLY
ncbi:MAG: hypothetical protein CM15mP127_12270 [Gammaproteobacteria bacterium]|nr:MAG: hypothetical protein CM15mP127_12270 [Gammaproteobacteria bacterium]